MIPEHKVYELDELLDKLTSGKVICDYDNCREYRAIYDIETDLADSIQELSSIKIDDEEWEEAHALLVLTTDLRNRYKSYL